MRAAGQWFFLNPRARALLGRQRRRMEEALIDGRVIPKDPRSVKATPPRLIGRLPAVASEPIRLALIRQRVEAMRRRQHDPV